MRFFRWHPSPQSHRAMTFLLLALCLAFISALDHASVLAEGNELTAIDATFGREYAVPNGPRNLVEEAPGRIWYTTPEAGGIGFLEVISDTATSTIRYRTDFYGFGENSRPHDLVYVDGIVWFTLAGMRALGKIDVVTREIETFMLLSPGAAPTGIDDDPDGRLWIAQSNGRVSRFDPATETFTEFVMPSNLAQAPRMEDVAYENSRNIWFSMPDANRILILDPVRNRFVPYNTEVEKEGEREGLSPTNISIDPKGRIWITANGNGQIGRFIPTTVTFWVWYDAPSASVDGGPAGIFTYIDENDIVQLWATESNIGSIGRLQIRNGVEVSNREKVGPNSPAGSTWGIIRTSDGHIWVADSGRNLLYELTAPYIRRTYMATIENNQVLPD
jgi:streptogramin lyase